MKIYKLFLIQIFIAFASIYSQDFWERTNGLDSASIYSLALNSDGDIFAGNGTDGVYRSTDNGISWSILGPHLGQYDYRIKTIFIYPNGDILIGVLDEFNDGGIYLSTDNGNSWTVFGMAIAEHPVFCIAVNSNGDIFAGTESVGIYRSTDNGGNWIQINQGLLDLSLISLKVNSSDYIFAGTFYSGVFRSTDNGDNWVQINQGLSSNRIMSLLINSNGDVFAGTYGGGIFRSTNNGENWVQINQGLTNDQSFYCFSLAINSGGDVFAATADGVYRSTDNGDNWVRINQGLPNFGIFSLAINSNDDIYAGTLDGIFRTIPSANIRVFLQGPYSSGSMSTALRDNGFIPLAQPYNVAPYNYSGTESVASIPAGVVDWVLLELRSDLTTQVSRRAAFLKSDGSIVDLDGVSSVKFPTVAPGDYNVVIRQRNHLAVMTANPIELSYSPVLYDFTTGQTQAYGTNAMKDLGGGFFGMWMGDVNSDGVVKYNLANNDRLLIYNRIGNAGFNVTVSGYYKEDVNMDGIVKYNLSNNDRLLIYNVIGNGGFNVTRSTQVP